MFSGVISFLKLYFFGVSLPPGTIILIAGKSSLEIPTNSASLEPKPSSILEAEI